MGFRLGVIKGWQSRWYADKNYKELLGEDIAIRNMINKDLANAAIARIEIERVAGTQITVTIYTAKPGIVIGKSGEKVDSLRVRLEALTKKKVHPKIMEVNKPELEAILVANSIAEQLVKRISFRRAMKQAVQKTMKAGAKGIKILCAGRLGGAEIARSEREVDGSVPLQTLRADIDFAVGVAHTTYGTIGIKVWIYRGDILPGTRRQTPTSSEVSADRPPRSERPRRDDRGGGRRDDRGGGGGRRDDRGGGGGFRRDDRGGGGGGRPMGDRPPRPQGQGAPFGDRPPRPQGPGAPFGDRPPRPQGQGAPFGDRPPRPQGPGAPFGDRPPRPAGPVNAASADQTPPPAPTNEANPPAPAPTTAPEQKPETE
jgi:small subunit ribosomal protein S3